VTVNDILTAFAQI